MIWSLLVLKSLKPSFFPKWLILWPHTPTLPPLWYYLRAPSQIVNPYNPLYRLMPFVLKKDFSHPYFQLRSYLVTIWSTMDPIESHFHLFQMPLGFNFCQFHIPLVLVFSNTDLVWYNFLGRPFHHRFQLHEFRRETTTMNFVVGNNCKLNIASET